MRMFSLAGTALLALSASVVTAAAAPITFGYTGGIASYTVPANGYYDILVAGASGGGAGEAFGGLGAEVENTIPLSASEMLTIAVALSR